MKLIFIFLLVFKSLAHEASVRFLENPEIHDEGAIYLNDIAELTHLKPEDQEALGKINIATSADELKKMSSRDIMKKIKPQLRAYESYCDCKLKITIPHAMVVRSLPGEFAIEKVRSTLEKELKKECSSCEYEISPIQIIRGQIPQSYTRWNIDKRVNEWRGPAMVRVYFDDDVFSPLILQSLIKIKKPVLKLKQNVNMGSEISIHHFESAMMDVTYEQERYAQMSDLVGMEARRTLGRGQAVLLSDLTARNIVRMGQPVAIEMNNTAFKIEMSGVAQKNGKLGDKIPVKINRTQKNVSAEVISDARVRM